ncbi:phosphoribosylanthranilate isomerase [Erythrobacter litoralis]|jgi:phosphoribosylanthranilate isomerase|uniref:N-(5'-phosphoribosyl)anthranilate isomerase n=1 Tax=Erythrobacter litoralis TaxID=39960 RepID=A0A074MIG6_9SPHN|nr:phosphoribosylanthranilate isomerase [Erythrobacter litoralis]AOL23259.1 phosphoribosylanthranilate isomerase [Erythrobacter litoralis]KEO92595.1 N-(5'-phosphoribosyl)anthranilate isomerase [Erythrobacter litoralis]MEE4338159.1 phosphoribosylanthranilate isomerase [Erythrobacter sp.]
MTREIKICGLSTPETVAAAVKAGASHVGFVHFEPSPRHVSLKEAASLRADLPGGVKAVLLLVNADIETTATAVELVRPDVIQFHGSETPEWIALVREKTGVEAWRAIGVRSAETLSKSARYRGAVDRLLFDAPPPEASALPGGNGVGFDWRLLASHDHAVSWGLAGGLDPDNVAEAIRATGAPLVDASSGLESAPGVKDPARIAAFCEAARTAG